MEVELDEANLSDSEIEDFFRENDELFEAETEGESRAVDQCYCGIPSSSQEVIRCDNIACPKQWFHLECVGLTETPDNEWFCSLVCIQQSAATSVGSMKKVLEELGCETPAVPSTRGESSSSSKIKTGKMTYPRMKQLEKADVISHGSEFLKTSIHNMKTSPLLKLNTPVAKGVSHLTKTLEENMSKAEVAHYVDSILSHLWEIAQTVRGKRWTEDMKCKMWHNFHVLRCNPDLRNQWNDLLSFLMINRQTEEETILFQHVLDSVFKSVLSLVMNTDMPPKEVTILSESMNPNEENALRYASGYVPYKLRKRFRKMKGNHVASLYVQVLDSWGFNECNGDSFFQYTKEWIDLQNRGGLFTINDDTYHFFKSLETILRSVLHTKNMAYLQSVDIQKVLFTKLLVEKTVNSSWCKVTPNLSPALSQRLLQEVLKTFLKMRCEAYIKVYLMIRKGKEESISRKGEKSLRKNLQK